MCMWYSLIPFYSLIPCRSTQHFPPYLQNFDLIFFLSQIFSLPFFSLSCSSLVPLLFSTISSYFIMAIIPVGPYLHFFSHILETMKYLPRYVWYISLSSMLSSCIHLARNVMFILHYGWLILHCTKKNRVYSLISYGLLAHCQDLAITNCAVINMIVHTSL